MDALGQLAAGIAHDFRNLISAMQGHIANARAQLAPNHPALQHLEQLQSAATQASGIAGSLLRYSARTTAEKKPVRLAAVVDQAVSLLRASLPASIAIDTSIPDPFIFVEADPSQLQQVVMNLALNARDAMPKGGTLTIAVDLSPAMKEGVDAKNSGNETRRPQPTAFARLTIRDSGDGMTPDTMARIFEPYFTTKPRGQGTGLGLSITQGIITEHGGSISVDSQPGQGSTFTILLPAIPAPTQPGPGLPEGQRRPASPSQANQADRSRNSHSRTALLIDPNPFIREVVASMLGSMNFQVLQAADADAASRLSSAANCRIDLLIAASHLPDGTGSATINRLRSSMPAPGPGAILIAAAPVNGDAPPDTSILLHPFRRADLVREVERLGSR